MAEPQSTGAFILHTRAFKETSLIIDAFTYEHGRVNLIAKGARGNSCKNNKRALLQPFQPLQISWLGRSDLKTLKQLEADGLPFKLSSSNNLCGLYINELLTKLLHQWDPQYAVFEQYFITLKQLAKAEKPQLLLREFELFLLDELGYAIDWHADIDGDFIEAEKDYVYLPEQGFQMKTSVLESHNILSISGKLILDVAERSWQCSGSLALARKVCRQIIDRLLDGKELNSRKLLQQTLALQTQ